VGQYSISADTYDELCVFEQLKAGDMRSKRRPVPASCLTPTVVLHDSPNARPAAGILLCAVQLVAHSRKIIAHMRDKTFDLAEPLAAAIRKVLFEEWDPCSVNLNAECEDEYDDYLPAIHKLAKNGNSAAEIAAQLNFVENTMMGGIGDKAVNLAVGGKIFALAEAAKRR